MNTPCIQLMQHAYQIWDMQNWAVRPRFPMAKNSIEPTLSLHRSGPVENLYRHTDVV